MTPEEYRQGRRRLRDLLPWARAEAKKGMDVRRASDLFGAVTPYLTEENFEALMVTPAPLGGWHCDLILKSVPPGIPNTLGSPVEMPYRTREDAEDAARGLLAMALFTADQPKSGGDPVFLLHGYTFRLMPEAINEAAKLDPGGAKGYGSVEAAINQIKGTLAELCPNGFSGDAFNKKWEPTAKARLLAVLHMSALSGLFAYPPRRDKPPPAEASETRH